MLKKYCKVWNNKSFSLDKLLFFFVHFQVCICHSKVPRRIQQDFLSSLTTPVRRSGQTALYPLARTSAGIHSSGRRSFSITHSQGKDCSWQGAAASCAGHPGLGNILASTFPKSLQPGSPALFSASSSPGHVTALAASCRK